MRERESFFALAAELAARREPFATATVVSAERPTSAKPGAKAIVTSDGLLQGWIGGSCAAPVVKSEALSALADGEPRLVVISDARGAPRAGTRHYPMTCHSGGELEIWIEPVLPAEQLVVTGYAPVVRHLARFGRDLGLRVVVADPRATAEDQPAADAVVVDVAHSGADARTAIVIATRGEYDEDAVRAALITPARYVALVASPTRGAVLVDALAAEGIARETLERLKYPAGIDIAARSEQEIALSILAEIVATRPAVGHADAATRETPEAIDPVCGMIVAVTADALSAEHGGTTYYFCGEGCRATFARDPDAVLAQRR